MTRKLGIALVTLAAAALLAVGCSDDSSEDKDGSTVKYDKGIGSDQGKQDDLGQTPDLWLPDTGGGKCAFEWQTAISPQQKVTTGAVTTTDLGGGVKQTEVDASAGGVSMEQKNPFVYISFKDGGKRVDLDDFKAKNATSWDLALRRTTIRVNGGDSGAGKGEVAIVENTTIDKVTTLPAASSFLTDDFLDDNCVIKYITGNYIKVAFGGTAGMWYEMDTVNMKIKPRANVWVLKLAQGNYVKLEITGYYKTVSGKDEGGHFTIKWAAIK